jgi:hypothetical protein
VLIEDVKVTVHRESDRVIDAVLGGPHERIVDRVSSNSDIYSPSKG